MAFDLVWVMGITVLCSTSLSALGALFILVSFVLVRDWSFPSNFIFFLSFCDFFHAIGLMYLDPKAHWLCMAQSVLDTFWALSSLFWTLSIAVVYWSQNTRFKHKIYGFEKLFHAIVWPSAAILATLPLAFGNYGFDPKQQANIPKCWIIESGNYARIWAYYGWVLLVMIGITVLYVYVLYKRLTRKRKHNNHLYETLNADYRRELIRTGMYPLVLWVLWPIPSITRVLEYAYPDRKYNALLVMTAALLPLQGFCNAFVYGFRNNLISKIKQSMCGNNRDQLRESLLPPSSGNFLNNDDSLDSMTF